MDLISPIDGRYTKYTKCIANNMSDEAYVQNRIYVEVTYLNFILLFLEINCEHIEITKL
jgi:hypothetical protein